MNQWPLRATYFSLDGHQSSVVCSVCSSVWTLLILNMLQCKIFVELDLGKNFAQWALTRYWFIHSFKIDQGEWL